MKKRNTVRAAAVAALLAGLGWPAAQALAQTAAYTSSPVDLFAGPSDEYPVVSEVDAGMLVTVMGCLNDYSWCDVALPGLRGWVYAAYLSYPYQGQYVPLQGYGSVIGLPIIGFTIGTYWDSFYRDRPWYGERDRWAHERPRGYGERPPEPPPGARGPQARRPVPPSVYGGHPEGPQMGGRPEPQERFQGNPGAPRPEIGGHGGGQPGANYGQRPVPQEMAPRPQAPQQPGGFRPGAPAAGVEHGGPQMRAPVPMQGPGRPAAPPQQQQGGHPSGGEGGGHREGRPQGQ
jgi:uncharacterized protein YraI